MLLLLSLSVSLIVFSDVCINASAADRSVTYTKITRSAGIDIFGSTIPYNCTSGGVTTSGQFVLQNDLVDSCTAINVDSNSVMNSSTQVLDYDWLIYTTTALSSQGYADFEISLPVTISDSARGAFLMSFTGLLNYSTTTENSILQYPDNYLNSSQIQAISQNTSASQNAADYYGYIRLDYSYNGVSDYFYYRPIVYDISGGIQSMTIKFEHVRSTYDGQFSFAIACPYVYGNIQSGSAVTSTTSVVTGTDINVNVDVDMTETNGILSTISGILSGIVDGIKGLFVPDSAWLSSWYASMVQALYDAFGDIPELNDQISQSIQNLINASAIENFQWPGVNVPGVGQISAPRLVPLKPNPVEFGSLYSFIRIAVNIVATCLVINMLINKFKAVLVGEVVVSDGD